MKPYRVAVLGGGLMGHGIAQVLVAGGHDVRVHDPDAGVLASVPERVAANLTALGRAPGPADRIGLCDTLADAVADAEWVFEAAPERIEVKRAVFAELESCAPADAVLATNTSVIPVGRIAAGLSTAGRVVGTHWWNPPYLVPLVEVVEAERTEPDVVARTIALLTSVGKEAVHVRRDVPGFVGNRLQHALWREAFALVADGVCDADTVDRVVKASFGRRLAVMGPIETADYVGLDLTLDIHEQIISDLDRTPGPSPRLRELVEQGHLGMKTGQGFRRWSAGSPAETRATLLRHLTHPQPGEPT
ncbi:MAG: 3-hydroxybutyryl-CoA dehydrogenase [Solirubrobacteraceae bacterium]|nr:3-hydroxybutyryl-CoA dehydrogenase [Solirubrobacteraceae bacterium]